MKAFAVTEYVNDDTIAAEATPPGRGGISVIRLSGKNSLSIASKIFSNKLPLGGQFAFGNISRLDDRHHIIDQAVVLVFQKPHSYTGEDVVEFSLHGSPIVVEETLQQLYQAGARQAGQGEFTFRAFLNDKMDLSQAEAVADLIEAVSGESARMAVLQLGGGLKDASNAISDRIAKLLMFSEIGLDFADEPIEIISSEQNISCLREIAKELDSLLEGYTKSKNIREGIDVTIVGAPNVGKSSILNALIGTERAIVHDTPGTTRDTVEGMCILDGIQFRFLDTAGLRVSEEEIETEGIARAKESAYKADLVLKIRSVDYPEHVSISQLPEQRAINIVNKNDLANGKNYACDLMISAKTGQNIERLKRMLVEKAGEGTFASTSVINRERHLTAVNRCRKAIHRCLELVEHDEDDDIIAEELRLALEAMDEITGKRRVENILNDIFSGFCIGK